MKQTAMQEVWEDLHEQPRFQPVYPHEVVVRWGLQNFKNKQARILDAGCGAGRHALFMAQLGHEVYATDLSRIGVVQTEKRAKEMGLTIQTQTNPVQLLDYEENFFDGIISYAVFNYAHYNDIIEALRRMRTQLKPEGKLIVVMRGERDWRLNYAEIAGPNMYKMNRLGNGTPSDVEQGMLQCYLDADGMRDLFKDFTSIELDIQMLSWQNGKYCDHDYIVQAVK